MQRLPLSLSEREGGAEASSRRRIEARTRRPSSPRQRELALVRTRRCALTIRAVRLADGDDRDSMMI